MASLLLLGRSMTDDAMDWLAVALDDDEPTIPEAIAWPPFPYDDETHPMSGLGGDEELPEIDWELELDSEILTRTQTRPQRAV